MEHSWDSWALWGFSCCEAVYNSSRSCLFFAPKTQLKLNSRWAELGNCSPLEQLLSGVTAIPALRCWEWNVLFFLLLHESSGDFLILLGWFWSSVFLFLSLFHLSPPWLRLGGESEPTHIHFHGLNVLCHFQKLLFPLAVPHLPLGKKHLGNDTNNVPSTCSCGGCASMGLFWCLLVLPALELFESFPGMLNWLLDWGTPMSLHAMLGSGCCFWDTVVLHSLLGCSSSGSVFSIGSCKNLFHYLLFWMTKISVSCDLIPFFPGHWTGFCCSLLTKEDLFSHQHFMKFFSGSPWLWSFSGHDVGPNLMSKWAASSAFKHLLFSCWGASVWQTLGITCSHNNRNVMPAQLL